MKWQGMTQRERNELRTLLQRGVNDFMAQVPPTSLSVSIVGISQRCRMLLLRRSLAVQTFLGDWTVGINETMKYLDEPGGREDLFGLIERGLSEELGLTRDDYGKIVISWLGWSEPASCFAAVSIVRIKLAEAEVDRRRGECHSVYEHDMTAWIKLNSRQALRIVERGNCPDGSKKWSYLAPLVAIEAARCHRLA